MQYTLIWGVPWKKWHCHCSWRWLQLTRSWGGETPTFPKLTGFSYRPHKVILWINKLKHQLQETIEISGAHTLEPHFLPTTRRRGKEHWFQTDEGKPTPKRAFSHPISPHTPHHCQEPVPQLSAVSRGQGQGQWCFMWLPPPQHEAYPSLSQDHPCPRSPLCLQPPGARPLSDNCTACRKGKASVPEMLCKATRKFSR